MILYQLQCKNNHAFDAWFRDSNAYEKQYKAGLLSCPTCGSSKVSKALMAPRIGKSAPKDNLSTTSTSNNDAEVQVSSKAAELRKKLVELRTQIEKNCDYVGPRFAEEARKIHYGETDPHSIYGETSSEDAKALSDEGIEFNSVPWLPKENA